MLTIKNHSRSHRRYKSRSSSLVWYEWQRIKAQSENYEEEMPGTVPNGSQNNDCSIRIDDHGDNVILSGKPINGAFDNKSPDDGDDSVVQPTQDQSESNLPTQAPSENHLLHAAKTSARKSNSACYETRLAPTYDRDSYTACHTITAPVNCTLKKAQRKSSSDLSAPPPWCVGNGERGTWEELWRAAFVRGQKVLSFYYRSKYRKNNKTSMATFASFLLSNMCKKPI